MEQEGTKIPQIKVQEPPPNCPVPPPCPVVVKPKPGLVVLRIFLVSILALVLAFVILAASGLRIVRKESLLDIWLASRKPTPIPTLVPEPTPTPDPTANWETYVNTKYSYQLQYPSTWLVQAMNDNEQLIQTSAANFRMTTDETPAESGFSLNVVSNPKNLSLTDWVKQNPDNGTLLSSAEETNSSVVIINELSWEKVEEGSIGYVPTGYVKYGLAHNGFLYYIVIYSADAKTLDQILSTFKFVTVTPTSS